MLEAPISVAEILQSYKLLKNKKSPFSDLIRNEMIKQSCKIMPHIYEKLFNIVLNSSIFPRSWCKGLISPIFKSGNTSDPANYRGICVSSCLGKFFCLILNQRLTNFVIEKKILHPSQIGFLRENRTSDHIFTLRTLIDKFVHRHNTKLYACFVDFRKAFDSIWHEGLFYRLLSYGISGKMFRIIKNLYSKSTCAIKIDNHRTSFFEYSRGVRQGCILSPLLFNLFLNELPLSIDYNKTDPILLPNGSHVNTLLYADDLVFISRSKIGLQNCLNTLESFCSTWLLEVNLKKTKVMIFQKCNRKPKNLQFYYQHNFIDIVQEYTYLGIKITPNGCFTMAQKNLCEKAQRAIFKVQKYANISKLPLRLAFKIFDATILPILTYGGEIWAVSKKSHFIRWDKSPIEQVHLKFCKIFLQLNRRASNIATRGVLGRLPIQLTLAKKALKYYSYLCDKDECTIVKQAFLISKQLESENQKSFVNELKSFLRETDCQNTLTNDSLRTNSLANMLNKITDSYLKFWQTELNNSPKLDFYRKIKNDFCASNYIDILKSDDRKSFTKLMISNHKLHIETGRHCTPRLPREHRVCQQLESKEIENEMHMLFKCSLYKKIRENFIKKQTQILKLNYDPLGNNDKFCQNLFKTNNKSSVKCTANFINQCFLLRNN